MGIKIEKENARVEVCPRSKGDYGYMFIGGDNHTFEEEMDICMEIEEQIIRHVDGTGRRYVNIIYDVTKVCEYCGSDWTEESNDYNGGCCNEDEKQNPQSED